MTTKDNQYSAHPTKAQLEAARAQAVAMVQALDFLISLSDEDYRALAKPSTERVDASVSLFAVVRNNPGLFPSDIIDLVEGERDAEARAALIALHADLAPVVKHLSDTLNAINSDLYRLGLNIYSIAKRYKDRLSLTDRALVEEFAKLSNTRG